MNFLIIGGDAAGMSAASRAKRYRPDLNVTVLEKTQDVSYSACGMPYNIADAQRDMDDLIVRSADAFRKKQQIELLTGHKATKIDPKSKTVSGATTAGGSFELPYDHLLIATGGRPVVPELPGFNLPGVMTLKSLDQGRTIKDFIRSNRVRKTVIIGMGYVGLEMAEALRQRDIDVEMVKPGPVFLPWMEPTLSHRVQQEVAQHSVGLHTGCAIEAVAAKGTELEVRCADRTFPADMVLVAIGIVPNSELAVEAGLKTSVDNAIAVDRKLHTSDPHIYAAGDCADAYHMVTGQKTWIPLALRANRAGWAVADNVCGKEVVLPGVAGTAVFKVFDLEVACTGITEKAAIEFGFDPAGVTIKTRSRAHAHPGATTIHVHMIGDRKTHRLLGVQMVGKEGVAHRVNAAAVALHGKMTVEQFSQADLAYAPPFGPVWDPLLTAANQLLKKI